MIELERHIEILLLCNDCVIVPDFGGFMAHHVDARYEEEDSLCLPPLRTLGFNPQLTMNDSLLVQSYIEAYDISYPEAIKKIEDEVRELKQHLENEGEYELNDLGTIRLNQDGKYEFEPCEAGILTPEIYGLSSFEFKRRQTLPVSASISAETEQEGGHTEVETSPLATKKMTDKLGEDNHPLASVLDSEFDTDTTDDEKTISIRVNVLRNLAVACIAILAFLLYPSTLSNGKKSEVAKSGIDTGLLYRIMPKDITSGKTDIYIKKTYNDKTNTLSESSRKQNQASGNAVTSEPSEPSSFYCLVLASRVSKSNATAYVETLHKKGYQEAVVLPKRNGTKVIYGQYPSEKEAYNALNKLHGNKEFAEAWVMHTVSAKQSH